jgi:lipopolysaccharide transport system ATP-binding protein
MSDFAIRVEHLSKQYKVGVVRQRRQRYETLRDQLVKTLRSPFRSNGRPHSKADMFWALQDVSFEVKPGQALGIIGRNGSGKSTLLKILSRITEPTTGFAEIRGRVGSLLEVGTGFHPELTGRENIYLNAAILGMRRAEIRHKFDEIVDFAEVEKFIDTPVKHYSSGMYVRLAFAVAAHLEPEILLVDEVLAVGDAAFQRKCLGKMEDVAKGGRTVLFVSHNMGAVETLCSHGVHLEQGTMAFQGPVRQAVSHYLSTLHTNGDNPFADCSRSGNSSIRISSFHMESQDHEPIYMLKSGDPVVFVIGFKKYLQDISRVSVGISLHAENELGLFLQYSHFSGTYFDELPDQGYFRCLIPQLPLAPGNYLVGLRVLAGGDEADWPKVYCPITVEVGDFYGTSSVETRLASWGYFLVKGTWSCE